MRAGSASPDRRRNGSREYSPDYENSVSPPRDRGFGRGRDSGRYRDYSPPHHGRGRFGGRFGGGRFGGGRFYGGRFGGGRFIGGRFGGGRFGGRFDGGYMGAGFRGDVVPKNNPNVRPREGDWMCTDPACNNLNFARRDSCNKGLRPPLCTSSRSHRGLPWSTTHASAVFPGPPMERSPVRSFNGYRSPPRGFGRDFGIAGPYHPRHEGRFPNRDHHRPDYFEDDMRDRNRFDRPMPPLEIDDYFGTQPQRRYPILTVVGLLRKHSKISYMETSIADELYSDNGEPKAELGQTSNAADVKEPRSLGYRDGLIAGKEASAQKGFNVGFKESVVVGYDWGLVRGVTG
ncbi:RNA-binding protein EWS-like protein, partial [Tanacetum coccineum]